MSGSGPIAPNRVFVDTSAFYAASDRDNRASDAARALIARLISERSHLVTTNFVLAELHALVLARGNQYLALTVLQGLRQSPTLTIERVTELDEQRAWEIIERYEDKAFSFVDAASFAVMERLGITIAFAIDRHFAQYGWTIIGEL